METEDKRIEIAQRIADLHKAKKPIQDLLDEVGQFDFLEQFVGQDGRASTMQIECSVKRDVPFQYFFPMMLPKNTQELFDNGLFSLLRKKEVKNGASIFFLKKAWEANNRDGFSCGGKKFFFSWKALHQIGSRLLDLAIDDCLREAKDSKDPGNVSAAELKEVLVLANKLCKKPYKSISELMFNVVYKEAKAIKHPSWESKDHSQRKKDFFKNISKVEKLFFID